MAWTDKARAAALRARRLNALLNRDYGFTLGRGGFSLQLQEKVSWTKQDFDNLAHAILRDLKFSEEDIAAFKKGAKLPRIIEPRVQQKYTFQVRRFLERWQKGEREFAPTKTQQQLMTTKQMQRYAANVMRKGLEKRIAELAKSKTVEPVDPEVLAAVMEVMGKPVKPADLFRTPIPVGSDVPIGQTNRDYLAGMLDEVAELWRPGANVRRDLNIAARSLRNKDRVVTAGILRKTVDKVKELYPILAANPKWKDIEFAINAAIQDAGRPPQEEVTPKSDLLPLADVVDIRAKVMAVLGRLVLGDDMRVDLLNLHHHVSTDGRAAIRKRWEEIDGRAQGQLRAQNEWMALGQVLWGIDNATPPEHGVEGAAQAPIPMLVMDALEGLVKRFRDMEKKGAGGEEWGKVQIEAENLLDALHRGVHPKDVAGLIDFVHRHMKKAFEQNRVGASRTPGLSPIGSAMALHWQEWQDVFDVLWPMAGGNAPGGVQQMPSLRGEVMPPVPAGGNGWDDPLAREVLRDAINALLDVIGLIGREGRLGGLLRIARDNIAANGGQYVIEALAGVQQELDKVPSFRRLPAYNAMMDALVNMNRKPSPVGEPALVPGRFLPDGPNADVRLVNVANPVAAKIGNNQMYLDDLDAFMAAVRDNGYGEAAAVALANLSWGGFPADAKKEDAWLQFREFVDAQLLKNGFAVEHRPGYKSRVVKVALAPNDVEWRHMAHLRGAAEDLRKLVAGGSADAVYANRLENFMNRANEGASLEELNRAWRNVNLVAPPEVAGHMRWQQIDQKLIQLGNPDLQSPEYWDALDLLFSTYAQDQVGRGELKDAWELIKNGRMMQAANELQDNVGSKPWAIPLITALLDAHDAVRRGQVRKSGVPREAVSARPHQPVLRPTLLAKHRIKNLQDRLLDVPSGPEMEALNQLLAYFDSDDFGTSGLLAQWEEARWQLEPHYGGVWLEYDALADNMRQIENPDAEPEEYWNALRALYEHSNDQPLDTEALMRAKKALREENFVDNDNLGAYPELIPLFEKAAAARAKAFALRDIREVSSAGGFGEAPVIQGLMLPAVPGRGHGLSAEPPARVPIKKKSGGASGSYDAKVYNPGKAAIPEVPVDQRMPMAPPDGIQLATGRRWVAPILDMEYWRHSERKVIGAGKGVCSTFTEIDQYGNKFWCKYDHISGWSEANDGIAHERIAAAGFSVTGVYCPPVSLTREEDGTPVSAMMDVKDWVEEELPGEFDEVYKARDGYHRDLPWMGANAISPSDEEYLRAFDFTEWLRALVGDVAFGAQDRHGNNWYVALKHDENGKLTRVVPLFIDNGLSFDGRGDGPCLQEFVNDRAEFEKEGNRYSNPSVDQIGNSRIPGDNQSRDMYDVIPKFLAVAAMEHKNHPGSELDIYLQHEVAKGLAIAQESLNRLTPEMFAAIVDEVPDWAICTDKGGGMYRQTPTVHRDMLKQLYSQRRAGVLKALSGGVVPADDGRHTKFVYDAMQGTEISPEEVNVGWSGRGFVAPLNQPRLWKPGMTPPPEGKVKITKAQNDVIQGAADELEGALGKIPWARVKRESQESTRARLRNIDRKLAELKDEAERGAANPQILAEALASLRHGLEEADVGETFRNRYEPEFKKLNEVLQLVLDPPQQLDPKHEDAKKLLEAFKQRLKVMHQDFGNLDVIHSAEMRVDEVLYRVDRNMPFSELALAVDDWNTQFGKEAGGSIFRDADIPELPKLRELVGEPEPGAVLAALVGTPSLAPPEEVALSTNGKLNRILPKDEHLDFRNMVRDLYDQIAGGTGNDRDAVRVFYGELGPGDISVRGVLNGFERMDAAVSSKCQQRPQYKVILEALATMQGVTPKEATISKIVGTQNAYIVAKVDSLLAKVRGLQAVGGQLVPQARKQALTKLVTELMLIHTRAKDNILLDDVNIMAIESDIPSIDKYFKRLFAVAAGGETPEQRRFMFSEWDDVRSILQSRLEAAKAGEADRKEAAKLEQVRLKAERVRVWQEGAENAGIPAPVIKWVNGMVREAEKEYARDMAFYLFAPEEGQAKPKQADYPQLWWREFEKLDKKLNQLKVNEDIKKVLVAVKPQDKVLKAVGGGPLAKAQVPEIQTALEKQASVAMKLADELYLEVKDNMDARVEARYASNLKGILKWFSEGKNLQDQVQATKYLKAIDAGLVAIAVNQKGFWDEAKVKKFISEVGRFKAVQAVLAKRQRVKGGIEVAIADIASTRHRTASQAVEEAMVWLKGRYANDGQGKKVMNTKARRALEGVQVMLAQGKPRVEVYQSLNQALRQLERYSWNVNRDLPALYVARDGLRKIIPGKDQPPKDAVNNAVVYADKALAELRVTLEEWKAKPPIGDIYGMAKPIAVEWMQVLIKTIEKLNAAMAKGDWDKVAVLYSELQKHYGEHQFYNTNVYYLVSGARDLVPYAKPVNAA